MDEFATRSAQHFKLKGPCSIQAASAILAGDVSEEEDDEGQEEKHHLFWYIDIILGEPNCWSFFSLFLGGRQGERTVWERAQREGELGALSVMLPQLGRKSPSRLVQGNICRNECWRPHTRHGTAVFFLWKIESLFK